MNRETLLSRLATLAGIEASYTDIYARHIDTPIEAKIHVLAALGFDVSSRTSLQAAVRAREEEPWRRCLAPWIVQTMNGAGLDLDVSLPADDAERLWGWEIVFEDGTRDHGSFRRCDLALLDARDIDGRRIEHRRLSLEPSGPIGYHRLRVSGRCEAEASLVLAPERCYVPPQLEGPESRAWGVSAHLYTLRSPRNWGVGDFSDLARLCRMAGEAGAAVVATNPLHALFPRRPNDASPYSPSSRLFLNPLYIDVAAVPGFSERAGAHPAEATLARLRATSLVEYPAVTTTKLRALEALFEAFRARLDTGHVEDKEVHAFRDFCDVAGGALQSFAAFSVLDELKSGPDRTPVGSPQGPCPDRTREASFDRLAGAHASRLAFHQYLQFLADRQLAQAAEDARHSGLAIGIMRDLSVGVSPDGADAWMHRPAFANRLRCGAPPDDFNPHGQEWGVMPFDPLALRRDYTAFIATLRANMRHAGGLRIDHVAGFERQFVVPLGQPPARGCYIRFPREELFAILALESRRNACLVLGEDLGTLPFGFRERMRPKAVFGCSVLYFERTDDARFRSPDEYRVESIASVGTHDLPTLPGYWQGRDIAAREHAGVSSAAEAEAAQRIRRADHRKLSEALASAGFALPAGDDKADVAEFVEAVHRFLAASSARLFLAQFDDLLGERDQINLPGTVDVYPNWRRKLAFDLEAPAVADALARLARLCQEHGRCFHGDPAKRRREA